MHQIIYRFSWLNKKDNNKFQFAVIVALNYEKVGEHLKEQKNKPFINKNEWEEINYSSEKGDWKRVEKNNRIVVFNVLYAKKGTIYQV